MLTSAYQAYAPRDARDGLEFVSISTGKSDEPRPMASRKYRIQPAQSEAPCYSGRAAGVFGEVAKVAGLAPPKHRAAVFKRRMSTSRSHRWTSGAGLRGGVPAQFEMFSRRLVGAALRRCVESRPAAQRFAFAFPEAQSVRPW